jgi:hypothetical protein
MANIRLTVLSESVARTRGRLYTAKQPFLIGDQTNNHVCGRCGATLVRGVDIVPIVNGAVRCNGCHSYNDLARPAAYQGLPPMLSDVANLPGVELREWLDERWDMSPHTRAISELAETLRGDWTREQGVAPNLIYHYTTPAGLRGILSSHRLWATDFAYLNDASEINYGFAFVRDQVANALHAATSETEQELLRRSDLSDSATDSASDFVSCFCSEGDLLSQWRSYAAVGSGYSVGINAHALVRHNQPILRRVIYDEPTQHRLIRSAITETCTLFRTLAEGRSKTELDADKTLPAFASFLASRLREFLYTFKHHGFSEEREWRLIFRGFNRAEYLPALQFRDGKIPVPYLPIALQSAPAVPGILPIIEVRHGPTLQPNLAEKTVRLMLERFGYEHVEISGSSTPLRA